MEPRQDQNHHPFEIIHAQNPAVASGQQMFWFTFALGLVQGMFILVRAQTSDTAKNNQFQCMGCYYFFRRLVCMQTWESRAQGDDF
jgi:hypothetical protein